MHTHRVKSLTRILHRNVSTALCSLEVLLSLAILGSVCVGITTSLSLKDWKLHGFLKLLDEANIA